MNISKKLHEAREAQNALKRAQSELVNEVVQSIEAHLQRATETHTALSKALNAPPLYIQSIIGGEHVPSVRECEEIMVHITGYGYDDDEYINAQEATKYMAKRGLLISYRTVVRHCNSGSLPAERQGVEWRILRGDVAEFITNYYTDRESNPDEKSMSITQFYEAQGEVRGVVDGKIIKRVDKMSSTEYMVAFEDGESDTYYRNKKVWIVGDDVL